MSWIILFNILSFVFLIILVANNGVGNNSLGFSGGIFLLVAISCSSVYKIKKDSPKLIDVYWGKDHDHS